MRKAFALAALVCASALVASAQDASHEYAPIKEQQINYKDWTFRQAAAGAPPINLRAWAQGKRLALVVYFAPWCPNWRNEAPVAAKLYEKYKDQGLEVIGVSEYGLRDDVKNFFGPQSRETFESVIKPLLDESRPTARVSN